MKTFSLAVAALAAAAALGLAGCGGGESSDGGGNTKKSQAEIDREQKFVQCLKQHGIEIGSDPNDTHVIGEDPKFDAAQAACAKYAPINEAKNEDITSADEDRALKRAECLRRHGVNAKDPKPGTANITIDEGAGDTPQKLVAAYTACNKEVPNPKPSKP
ncbi:hypothetical protein ACH35V_25740 [Actinomadura sp. 1N219]|uniref:hypothetical protein n=1 Tax=Actinomadura sp. 1N219 TaxID=3375152 RepID=UPI0037ABE4E1